MKDKEFDELLLMHMQFGVLINEFTDLRKEFNKELHTPVTVTVKGKEVEISRPAYFVRYWLNHLLESLYVEREKVEEALKRG